MPNPIFRQFDLTGRVALVTGSSQGIGRCIALALAGSGANVFIHHKGDHALAEQCAADCAAFSVKTAIGEADFTRPGAAAAIHAELVKTHRPAGRLRRHRPAPLLRGRTLHHRSRLPDRRRAFTLTPAVLQGPWPFQ